MSIHYVKLDSNKKMTVSFCLDGNIDKDFGPHFNCASKSSPLGMQQ